MKKLFLITLLALGFTKTANTQVNFGIKAGINYNSDSFVNVKNDVLAGAKSRTGYHAGIWLRVKIPALDIYVRPELVYTNLENDVTYTNSIPAPTSLQTSYAFQKIDIPVLFGKKYFKFLNLFAGPSFQYVLKSDFILADLKDVKTDGFTVGLQVGAGLEFGNLGIDIRWERAFSDIETRFLDGTNPLEFDTRVNQIIIGVSYKL